MKTIGMVLILAILLLPTFVSADCADLERYTGWILDSPHAVIFYAGKRPLARVELQNCEIRPLSRIRLLSSYVCESDEIEIDGEACHIVSLELMD